MIGGSTTLVAQMPGLCDPANRPAGAVEGGFEIIDNITIGCSPLEIQIQDNSGGIHLNYYFDYNGEHYNYLPNNLTATSSELRVDTKARLFTILQFGEKDGKPMYACKQVYVRPDNKPIMSYFACNQNIVEISIPDTIHNNFDYYTVDWNDGSGSTLVNQLPFYQAKDFSEAFSSLSPVAISIQGMFYNGSNNCSITSPIQVSKNSELANIDKLTLKTMNKAEIVFNGSYDIKGYSLFMKEQVNNTYPATPIKNVSPGTFSIPIVDSTKSYCFQLRRAMACGTETSAELCTIPLEVNMREYHNQLDWSPYPNTITPYDNISLGRYLNKTQKIIKLSAGIEEELKATPDQNHYKDSTSYCVSEDICYRVQLVTEGQIYRYDFSGKSISNPVCVNRKLFLAPPLYTLHANVENENKIRVDFIDSSLWKKNKSFYYLYLKELETYKKIDSVSYHHNSFSYNVDNLSDESLCFKVGYIDQCGSHSLLSPEVCTVHLRYDDPVLQWTAASPFSPGLIQEYEVEEVKPTPASIGRALPPETSYTPEFGDTEDEITYRIRAIDENGNFSLSNVVSILPVFGMYLPTAFSPNGDLFNESLTLKGKKRMIKDFSLEIFDRDRNKIFSTHDKDFSWNGKVNDTPLPPGTYSLFVRASLVNGEVVTMSEKITILY